MYLRTLMGAVALIAIAHAAPQAPASTAASLTNAPASVPTMAHQVIPDSSQQSELVSAIRSYYSELRHDPAITSIAEEIATATATGLENFLTAVPDPEITGRVSSLALALSGYPSDASVFFMSAASREQQIVSSVMAKGTVATTTTGGVQTSSTGGATATAGVKNDGVGFNGGSKVALMAVMAAALVLL